LLLRLDPTPLGQRLDLLGNLGRRHVVLCCWISVGLCCVAIDK
jgi:hypothetical protein